MGLHLEWIDSPFWKDDLDCQSHICKEIGLVLKSKQEFKESGVYADVWYYNYNQTRL